MSPPINVLAMIHGISPEPVPESPDKRYRGFWRSLVQKQPILAERFPHSYIGVSWGRELPQTPKPQLIDLRPDQCLTRSQNFINQRTSYAQIKTEADPANGLLQRGGKRGFDFPWLSPMARGLIANLREQTLVQGVGDAIYYCSRDGEFYIRRAVYGQVLSQLDDYLDAANVKLHLISHSLGVTIAHDFLYGLFATNHQPDYYRQGEASNALRFERWRTKAQAGELTVGSFTSMASQLPLFAMRKQELVDQLAADQLLNAHMIGLGPHRAPENEGLEAKKTAAVKWQLFYDVDDLLAFGTRRLYDQPDAIREFQVDTGDNPAKAHVDYWNSQDVIEKTAQLLARESR